MNSEQKMREALERIAVLADKYSGEYPTQVGAIAREALTAHAGEQVGLTESWHVGWAVLAHNGNIRIWHEEKSAAEASQRKYGGELVRLTTIAPAEPADIPDGYVLVPENPTDEMYEAATDKSWNIAGRLPCGHHDLVSAIWVEMINEAKRNGGAS